MNTFKLNNGLEIPVTGFGVYQISKEDCKESVLSALKAGYRHIDTAQAISMKNKSAKPLKQAD